LSEEFEREREGIYFFPFFSKEKAQKDYMHMAYGETHL
jgi:hypothetical protein